MKVLVTGGCGFLGHHLVEHIYRNTDWEVIILDKLTYASFGFKRLENANLIPSPRIKLFTWDICSKFTPGMIFELGKIDIIIHLAADTHVDNSIADPVNFIHNNVMSTVNLLEYARTSSDLKTFLYFSTDEVYGTAPIGTSFTEDSPHSPSNPYSASKSCGEMICLAYENTYNIPLIITNTVNIIGERQCVEKFVPKVIKTIRDNETIEIHSYPDCKNAGSRFYIHARNVSDAILFILEKGKIGEKYNITEDRELDNLELALKIAKIMNSELKYTLVDFHVNRPGHDLRYDLNGEKLRKLGWKPPVCFEESLKKIVEWTMRNQEWLE